MILRFPYLEEPIQGAPPPSLPQSVQMRWRPLVPVGVHGPVGKSLALGRALLDSGADDTILPLDVATLLGVQLLPLTGHAMRWRGQRHTLQFGAVELELVDEVGIALCWAAVVGFSAANLRYPLLGIAGCFCFFDVRFLGKNKMVEIEPNDSFPSGVGP